MLPPAYRRALVLFALVPLAAIACGAFGSDSVTSDAAADAATEGASPPGDGGDGDAVADSGPGAAREAGCSAEPDATFCDDFDPVADAASGWMPFRAGTTQLGVDSTYSLSPPNALYVYVPSNAPPGTIAEWRYATGSPVHAITVDFDLFPGAMGDTDSPSVLEILLDPGSQVSTARLLAQRSQLGAQLYDSVTDPSMAQRISLLDGGLPLGAWTHVTFTLELSADGSMSTVDVALPDLPVAATKKQILGSFPQRVALVSIGLNNIVYSGSDWRFWYDNVAITVK